MFFFFYRALKWFVYRNSTKMQKMVVIFATYMKTRVHYMKLFVEALRNQVSPFMFYKQVLTNVSTSLVSRQTRPLLLCAFIDISLLAVVALVFIHNCEAGSAPRHYSKAHVISLHFRSFAINTIIPVYYKIWLTSFTNWFAGYS